MIGRMNFRLIVVWFAVTMMAAMTAVGQKTAKDAELADIAGEWELVSGKVKGMPEFDYIGGRMSIKVNGSEVKIIRSLEDADGTIERTLTYKSDGSGEVNSWLAMDGKTEIHRKTKSFWKKGKLSIRWSQKSNTGWHDTDEIYWLAPDLGTLTFEVVPVLTRPGLPPRFVSIPQKLVFRRKE